jgi:hypothetical protein
MNKKIKETLDSWDWKSISLIILILSIGLVIYFYFISVTDGFRTSKEENYKGLTKGQIVNIQKIARMTQSKWNGTKIIADKYSISYRYEINGQKFERTDVIPITRKNQKLLKEILDNGLNGICSVKFDVDDPNKSLLIQSRQ